MFEKQFDIASIITAHQKGEVTEESRQKLELWLTQDPKNRELFDSLSVENTVQEKLAKFSAIDETTGWTKVVDGIAELPMSSGKARKIKLWSRVGIAAAIACLVFGAGLVYFKLNDKTESVTENVFTNDIAPGKMGATLTLANGKQILLSNAANGELAKESGVSITKTKTGELLYEIKDQTESSQYSTNILSTAKGETYQVVLPDGSKVWLNAASSLKYPAKFTSLNQRKVQLDGEAYFEVAKDKAHPFVVSTAKQDVEVLGTHFNINSYADEPATKTTLLEGSVKVKAGKGNIKMLKPGEQSVLSGIALKVQPADTEEAMAWVNGKIVFKEESLESIMRKVSRWYDVEIIFSTDVDRKATYMGSVSRSKKISSVLNFFRRAAGLEFKIEGKRVTVNNKN